MKFLTICKFLLILILPFLLFLLVLDYAAFDKGFYQEKFMELNVQQDVPAAMPLHEKVISFINGKNNQLPNEFNEREKQHLLDVRKIAGNLAIALYSLIALFVLLIAVSAFALKINNYLMNFVGKVLVFGGFLAVALAVVLFFLISLDFSNAFESFHSLFFEKGTYIFDPANEIIVRLYPEQLFMDLGLRISKGVFFASAAAMATGAFLMLKPKSKKNK